MFTHQASRCCYRTSSSVHRWDGATRCLVRQLVDLRRPISSGRLTTDQLRAIGLWSFFLEVGKLVSQSPPQHPLQRLEALPAPSSLSLKFTPGTGRGSNQAASSNRFKNLI